MLSSSFAYGLVEGELVHLTYLRKLYFYTDGEMYFKSLLCSVVIIGKHLLLTS